MVISNIERRAVSRTATRLVVQVTDKDIPGMMRLLKERVAVAAVTQRCFATAYTPRREIQEGQRQNGGASPGDIDPARNKQAG